ncbi:MAG: hypothetical protein CSYNP_03868 [Syntrophus sp. SKADARSKE-3]|nr:hypothetical protein [Syntrophus sp. SKADARSKE-3]
MINARTERIEFNPQKDLWGRTIEKKRMPTQQTVTGLIERR